MAGLKCAPEMTASVWIRPNSRKTCTSPMTEKSMNGFGFCWLGDRHVQRHDGRDEEDEQQRADELGDIGGGPTVLHFGHLRDKCIVRPYCSPPCADSFPLRCCSHASRAAAAATPANTSEPGTIALDFQPNAVHAGIYATDLKIRVPAASTDSLKLLAASRADMSVVDIHDLGLAREAGSDVVGVGALVQRPLAAVIARAGDIRRPRDLEGKRVGVTGLPSDEAVLRAVVENDGGDYDKREEGDDRLLGGSEPDRREGRRRGRVLERRGRGAAPARREDASSSAWTTTARRATPSSSSS